jgi:hypothetical protein
MYPVLYERSGDPIGSFFSFFRIIRLRVGQTLPPQRLVDDGEPATLEH